MDYKIVKKQEKLVDVTLDKMIAHITDQHICDENTRYLNVLNDILSNVLYDLREDAYEKS